MGGEVKVVDLSQLENENNVPEYSDTEIKAMDKGWRPQDDWEGDPDAWVGAGEFIRRGELMDRISQQSRDLKSYQAEIDALKKGMEVLTQHQKDNALKEHDRTYEQLKLAKAKALAEEEHLKVVEIEESMDELKERRKELDSVTTVDNDPNKTQQETPSNDPRVETWIMKNDWYLNDTAMRGVADAYADEYVIKNPHDKGDVDKVLDYVANRMQTEFPERTGGIVTNRRKPQTIEPNSTGGTAGGKKGSRSLNARIAELSPIERQVANDLVKKGTLTMEEYLDKVQEVTLR